MSKVQKDSKAPEKDEKKATKAAEKGEKKAQPAAPPPGKEAPAAAAPTPAPAAAPTEAAPETKVKKERKKAKPKVNIQVWKLYDVKEGALTRLRKECPRCGRGYFMAEHKDRQSCGHCGFTTFRTKS